MTRSERMQPIKALADTRERNAGAVVAAARRIVEDREKQLEQLRQYRAEYAARAAREGAADAVRLQNYHAFIARLADAIRQQEQLVAAAKQDLERKLAEWQERRVEAASLGKAVERIADVEQKAADRREQLDSDERALRTRRPDD
jgi:flagellar FliJ protein